MIYRRYRIFPIPFRVQMSHVKCSGRLRGALTRFAVSDLKCFSYTHDSTSTTLSSWSFDSYLDYIDQISVGLLIFFSRLRYANAYSVCSTEAESKRYFFSSSPHLKLLNTKISSTQISFFHFKQIVVKCWEIIVKNSIPSVLIHLIWYHWQQPATSHLLTKW